MKRKNRDTPGRRIAQAIIAAYKPKSVAQMQAALKEVFGPMFEAMLNGEMESYLGYRAVLPSLGKISRDDCRRRFVKLCTQPMRLRRLIPVLAR